MSQKYFKAEIISFPNGNQGLTEVYGEKMVPLNGKILLTKGEGCVGPFFSSGDELAPYVTVNGVSYAARPKGEGGYLLSVHYENTKDLLRMCKSPVEPMKWTAEQLRHVIAQVCSFGANHFDDEWRSIQPKEFSLAMEAVSMAVACFLAQNTHEGSDGVEWAVVHKDLVDSKWENDYQHWLDVADRVITVYGGVKSCT